MSNPTSIFKLRAGQRDALLPCRRTRGPDGLVAVWMSEPKVTREPAAKLQGVHGEGRPAARGARQSSSSAACSPACSGTSAAAWSPRCAAHCSTETSSKQPLRSDSHSRYPISPWAGTSWIHIASRPAARAMPEM